VFADPVYLARMALAEGALCSLLRAAQADDASDAPDTIEVRLGPEGLEVTYLAHGIPVGGHGL
jgi:hypothetical protein